MGQVVKVSSSHFNKHTVPNQITTFKKKKKKHELIQCNFFCIITPDLCSSVGGGEKQEQESRAIVCHVTVICVHGVGPQPCEASSIKQSKQ